MPILILLLSVLIAGLSACSQAVMMGKRNPAIQAPVQAIKVVAPSNKLILREEVLFHPMLNPRSEENVQELGLLLDQAAIGAFAGASWTNEVPLAEEEYLPLGGGRFLEVLWPPQDLKKYAANEKHWLLFHLVRTGKGPQEYSVINMPTGSKPPLVTDSLCTSVSWTLWNNDFHQYQQYQVSSHCSPWIAAEDHQKIAEHYQALMKKIAKEIGLGGKK